MGEGSQAVDRLVQVRADAGLCTQCAFQREIQNDRGSVFSMCRRSFEEPEYPKYPRLPVLQCKGFEKAPSSPSS